MTNYNFGSEFSKKESRAIETAKSTLISLKGSKNLEAKIQRILQDLLTYRVDFFSLKTKALEEYYMNSTIGQAFYPGKQTSINIGKSLIEDEKGWYNKKRIEYFNKIEDFARVNKAFNFLGHSHIYAVFGSLPENDDKKASTFHKTLDPRDISFLDCLPQLQTSFLDFSKKNNISISLQLPKFYTHLVAYIDSIAITVSDKDYLSEVQNIFNDWIKKNNIKLMRRNFKPEIISTGDLIRICQEHTHRLLDGRDSQDVILGMLKQVGSGSTK